MSTNDAVILTPILLATIAALIAIRLTFRNAATAPSALFTPAVFAVCGALIGISIGMICFADRDGRVRIEKVSCSSCAEPVLEPGSVPARRVSIRGWVGVKQWLSFW